MKEKYQIELYTAHDLDLITFKNCYKVNISKAIYCSLKAFTQGDTFVIKYPEKRDVIPKYRRKYRCQVSLDTEKDKDEIELLSKIADGYRNNFFKNLLRMYIRSPLTYLFLKDEADIDFFNEKFMIFKDGVKLADAASMKKDLAKTKFEIPEVDGKKSEIISPSPEPEKQKKKDHVLKEPKKEQESSERLDLDESIENADLLDEMFSNLF